MEKSSLQPRTIDGRVVVLVVQGLRQMEAMREVGAIELVSNAANGIKGDNLGNVIVGDSNLEGQALDGILMPNGL